MGLQGNRVPESFGSRHALDDLLKINWDLAPVFLTDEHREDCGRYILGLSSERYGRGLTELEETYERSRWFRSQAMIPNQEGFNQLTERCFRLVSELSKEGGQTLLGTRADLQAASAHQRPSNWVEFKPQYPPDSPPLNGSEYEALLGGPHIFGARLLWWCAAANSPQEFGYSPGFAHRIWTQPFWFLESAGGKIQVNPRPLHRLREAAIYCVENAKFLDAQESIEQTPPNGPGPACTFNWDGKQIELQPIQAHLMEFLWKTPKTPVPVEELVDKVWRGKPLQDDTYSGHASKLSKRFLDEGIPIQVHYRKAHFSFDIHKGK